MSAHPRSSAVTLRVCCDRIGLSYRTAERRLAEGTFPIPALPRLRRQRGVKHLFSSVDIDRYLDSASTADVR
jgi:hypothetical protein